MKKYISVLSLILADFEQAFDTVEWPFVGQAWVKWINYFYTDIPSAHLLHVVLPESVR
jgi:hypothetical protein